jgi:hypothetical protein
MADAQQNDLGFVASVINKIGSTAEWDDQFAIFRIEGHYRATRLRRVSQDFHSVPNSPDGTAGRSAILVDKKAMQSLDIDQGGPRPPYTWHCGGGVSSPASSLANHASASSPVTCKPVDW